MSAPLPPLEQEHKAWAALRAFATDDRSRGEDYFRQGRVLAVSCAVPGTHYQADVEGTEVYEVDWEYESGKWVNSCSCPLDGDCKHAYAALKTLLLSPTSEASGVVTPAGKPKPAARHTPSVSPLGDQLRQAVGRELTRKEIAYLRLVHAIAGRVAVDSAVYPTDFTALGLTPPVTHTVAPLNIWPAPPKDEHELWLYLVHATQLAGGSIPKFMEPVSDLAHLGDRLRHWQREREVEAWQQRLRAVVSEDQPVEAAAPTELRVRLSQVGAELEARRPGAEAFEPLKSAAFARLTEQLQTGQATLTPEQAVLWQTFRSRYSSMGVQSRVHVRDADATRVLSFLLRTPPMRAYLATPTGTPYVWSDEPLRWRLTPAESDDGDYLLRLITADGQATPPVLLVVAGSPVLYVGKTTVFTGPPLVPGVVDPTRENRIPAAAFERPEGVALLHRLGLELPPRLRQRVEHRPLRLRLTASLRPLNHYGKSEELLVRVHAFSADGAVLEYWTPQGWGTERTPPSKAKADRAIVFYDRTALAGVGTLMAPLNCHADRFEGELTKRVTKKFPEEFAAWLRTIPPEVEVKLEGELASFTEGAIAGTVQLEATEAGTDWFDLRVILNVADTQLTQAEIKLLLSAKGGFVRLEKKGWRKLEFKLSPEEDEQLARLGLTPREFTDEPQRLHALQLADPAARKFLPEAQTLAVQRRAAELKARVAPALPAGLKAELRPYQLEGFHFLAYLAANRFGGILADDMGLGKTLQTLARLLWLRTPSAPPQTPDAGPRPLPSLVVCPKSVTDNWRAEVERFAPGLRVKVWSGTAAEDLPALTGTADLHVLNYTQLRLVGESLARTDFQAVILDEGQYIKNPSSQTAQIARALRAEHRLVLSGTPIENRLLDLWSLMSFAMPGVLGSRAQFTQLYDAKEDPHARRRLSARVRPFLLRRTKSQVARDLPDRVEEDLYCEIEGEQKTLYRAELKRAQQMLLKVSTQKQLNQDRFHFLTSLLRLRQICCHPRLVKADSKAESAKLEALLDQLEPLMDEGHKVLVFSQFVSLLDLLKVALAEKGWPVHYLAGDTENRGAVVRDFQAQPGGSVFLISLKAGGFGLNLTAASYVVLFDPWWNPAVEAQAIDRTHRIGQTHKVIAYRLLIKDSIEEKIRALQKTKRALAEDVLGEEKFAQALTLDDLRFLFAD